VAPKERMTILMYFVTEGKIVFSSGRYLLLQAKMTKGHLGKEKFIQEYLGAF
jgi:hypothetical protein